MTVESGIVKSVHKRLLNVRDKTGEQFNHLLIRYGLERLLYRLVESGQEEMFILKGAMLFAIWHDVPGRPTRDIDLLGFGEISHRRLKKIFEKACGATVIDDGLVFDADSITTDDIRDDREYHGIRLRLLAFLGNARLPIQVDVGFGDAILPEPIFIEYPALLAFPAPRLRAYHPATVVAEKLNAMIELGLFNSRLKDFYDIHIILRHMNLNDDELSVAIKSTFDRRNTAIPSQTPVAFSSEFINDGNKEIQWQSFLRRNLLTDYGFRLKQVIYDIHERIMPILINIGEREDNSE